MQIVIHTRSMDNPPTVAPRAETLLDLLRVVPELVEHLGRDGSARLRQCSRDYDLFLCGTVTCIKPGIDIVVGAKAICQSPAKKLKAPIMLQKLEDELPHIYEKLWSKGCRPLELHLEHVSKDYWVWKESGGRVFK